MLKEHKGINLPGVDYVALSFVRKAEDVREARRLIRQYQEELGISGKHFQTDVPLIVKLEKPEAVARLDEILDVVDGVMIARGDLGVEMPPEKVPLIQKRVIARCNEPGLPVITATQMLESMVTNPRPTRAEVSDISNATLRKLAPTLCRTRTRYNLLESFMERLLKRAS